MDNITKTREFIDPTSCIMEWRTCSAQGASEIIFYRDEDSGTYARMFRFPVGFGEGVPYKEGEGGFSHDEFDEVVYIASGGLINKRLGYRYQPGMVAVFPKGTAHGPFLTPFGILTLEFRHYCKKNKTSDITKTPEFIEPTSKFQWADCVPQGYEEMIFYRDEDLGTHARLVRLPVGFGEGVPYKEGKGGFGHDEFDEIVYIASGGLINKRLGYRYQPGTVAVFPKGTSHGPFEAPFGALTVEFRHYKKNNKKF